MKIRFYGKLGEKLGPEIDVYPPAGTDSIVKLREVLADMFPDVSAELRQRSRAVLPGGSDHHFLERMRAAGLARPQSPLSIAAAMYPRAKPSCLSRLPRSTGALHSKPRNMRWTG